MNNIGECITNVTYVILQAFLSRTTGRHSCSVLHHIPWRNHWGFLDLVTMPTKGSFLSAKSSLCPIAAAHRVCTLIPVFTRARSAIPRVGHTQILSLGENDSLALGQVEERRDRVGFGENPPGVVRRDGGRGCVSKDWSGWWALVVK